MNFPWLSIIYSLKLSTRSCKDSFGKRLTRRSITLSRVSLYFFFCALSKRFSKLSNPLSCLASWALTAPRKDLSVWAAIWYRWAKCSSRHCRCGVKSIGYLESLWVILFSKTLFYKKISWWVSPSLCSFFSWVSLMSSTELRSMSIGKGTLWRANISLSSSQ